MGGGRVKSVIQHACSVLNIREDSKKLEVAFEMGLALHRSFGGSEEKTRKPM